MLIWDPDVITSSDDLFESREKPTKVSVAQTRSRGQPGSKDIDVARAPQIKLTLDHPKIPFSPREKTHKHPYQGISQDGLQRSQRFEKDEG